MKVVLPISIVFCISILTCCKKETIIKEVPHVSSWLLDSSLFGYNKILLTSLRLNDSVLAAANSTSIWYVNSNKLNASINGAFINLNPIYGYLVPPSLTKSIGACLIDSNRLKIFSIVNPTGNFGQFTFSPVFSNSATSIKGFPLPAFPSAGYPIINSKYILAPTEIDYANKTAIFNLIKVNASSLPFPNSVSLESSENIVLTPAPSTIGFSSGGYFSTAYFDKFFVSFNNQFYRVDTSGNVKSFGYNPVPGENGIVSQMFTINNYLFAIGGSNFFISQDKGESWSVFYNAAGSQYSNLTYLNVGNDLYAIFQSQIWKVSLSGSSLNFLELDNDGLQTNQITSINKAGKYAFVTTLAGLFYRDTSGLNTPKK